MRCAICGAEHELLEPAFSRPDIIFAMSPDDKKGRVLEGDDICALRGEGSTPDRFFVRCTLPVRLLDAPESCHWGLWAEIGEEDAATIWKTWDDSNQDQTPPMQARLANRVPGYPDTIGLPALLKLTGPKTRPELSLLGDSVHPFVKECLAGVTSHRVSEWLGHLAD